MDLPSSVKHALSLREQQPNILHSYFWYSGGSDDTEFDPFVGRRNGSPLQYSCLENPHGQRSLAGYSPWGCKESDMTE